MDTSFPASRSHPNNQNKSSTIRFCAVTTTFTLPWPPTGNHAVKHTRYGAHYATPQAKAYRYTIAALIAAQRGAGAAEGPLAVEATFFPPDARRRDLDNLWKTLADALTAAGLWQDDSQIRRLTLTYGTRFEAGAVTVRVKDEKKGSGR
jgi:crossover junction endodeoxyribonuclease RusA